MVNKSFNYIFVDESGDPGKMQMSDLISGAIKEYFTKRNTDLKKVINKRLLVKIF